MKLFYRSKKLSKIFHTLRKIKSKDIMQEGMRFQTNEMKRKIKDRTKITRHCYLPCSNANV